VDRLDTVEEMNRLIEHFEKLYTTMLTLAAKPDVGEYQVTEVCVVAKVATVKPKLRKHELQGKVPLDSARKGTRPVYQKGQWGDADIWRMEDLQAGNEIDGLAVIEASNTTLFVPPDWHVRIDEHEIYWLERKDV
jgi:acetone carboxylase beta subunit